MKEKICSTENTKPEGFGVLQEWVVGPLVHPSSGLVAKTFGRVQINQFRTGWLKYCSTKAVVGGSVGQVSSWTVGCCVLLKSDAASIHTPKSKNSGEDDVLTIKLGVIDECFRQHFRKQFVVLYSSGLLYCSHFLIRWCILWRTKGGYI